MNNSGKECDNQLALLTFLSSIENFLRNYNELFAIHHHFIRIPPLIAAIQYHLSLNGLA